MPIDTSKIVGKEHCDCLNRVLSATPSALELAEIAKECGWPAQEFINQLQSQADMATKAKAKLFPHEP